MQVGTNQSTAYHSQPSAANSGGQTGRSSSTSRQGTSQYDNEQLANIRPRLCILRKWPHYDGKNHNVIITDMTCFRSVSFIFKAMVFI